MLSSVSFQNVLYRGWGKPGLGALGAVTVGAQGLGQLLQKPPHFPRCHCVGTAAGTSLGGAMHLSAVIHL